MVHIYILLLLFQCLINLNVYVPRWYTFFNQPAKTRIVPKNSKNNNKQESEADLILHKADEEADEVHVKSEPEAEIQIRI